MLKERHERLGASDGPVFPDSVGGYRDRNNVGRAFREVRAGTEFAWVKTHTYRKTVETVLDGAWSVCAVDRGPTGALAHLDDAGCLHGSACCRRQLGRCARGVGPGWKPPRSSEADGAATVPTRRAHECPY